MSEIQKIEYIIHPAFAVGLTHLPKDNQTEAQMEKYISQVILPVIKKAQREPNTFVILLKSPVSAGFEKQDEAKKRIEEKLGRIVKRLLPKRSVVVKTHSVLEHKNPKSAATEEILQTLEKFNIFSKRMEIHAYGSFRDMCVNSYSAALKTQLPPQTKLKILEAGTIPFKGERTAAEKRLILANKLIQAGKAHRTKKLITRRR